MATHTEGGMDIILTKCVVREGDLGARMPTFQLEGTANGRAFTGWLALELDGRDAAGELNDPTRERTDPEDFPGPDEQGDIIMAVYEQPAYQQAIKAYEEE